MEEKKKRNSIAVLIPILVALIGAITSVAYIVFRMSSNRSYEEQWKDYDDAEFDMNRIGRSKNRASLNFFTVK